MKNNYALLESGWIPGHPLAFKPNAVGKIQLYGSVADSVGDFVGDVVGGAVDIVGDVVDVAVDVVEDVADTVVSTVETALDNPIATIATVAAAATGQAYLIPYINGANTLAQGGDFEDALKSAAVSYAAQGVGSYVGDQLGTALEYGTDLGSSQTGMLAAQTGDMLGGTTSGTIGGAAGAAAAGATAAALSGGDVDQAFINALGNYLVRTGVRYSLNEAGKLVDEFGREAPPEVVDEIMADAEYQVDPYEVDNIGNIPQEDILGRLDPYEVDNIGNIPQEDILGRQPTYSDTIDNGDGTTTQVFDDGSTLTVDANDNVVSSTTVDGETIYPTLPDVLGPDPYEVDNIGNIPQEDILGRQPTYSDTIDNGDGTTTQVFDDGSTLTVDENDNVINSTTVDGETIYPTAPYVPEVDPYEVDNVGNVPEEEILGGVPEVDPYEVDNVGNIPEENILGEVPAVDPYEVDNVGNIPEEDILAGDDTLDKLGSAAGNYFKNQFTNALTNQITGGLGLRPSGSTGMRPVARPSVGLPGSLGIYDLLGSLGFDPSQMPSATPSVQSAPATDEPLRLWDPGIDSDWAPLTKIGGLGFAGKYLSPDDTQYINKNTEERDRMIEEARLRGWMTDEERQTIENDSQFFDYDVGSGFDQVDATAGMTPWLTPGFAEGGLADHNPEFYSEGGASIAHRYVKGDGDGTSDSVPAMLASGEFVIPADVVSGLGNGDNDAGAKVLDEFMKSIRHHKRSTDPQELPPDSKGALTYLSEAQKKVGKKHGRS
jgi:hypothetical protein